MHAIQASFCALQITDNMEKWSKMVARGGPKIHQKSWKVNPGTLQGSSVCIFTQLDHQNASQGHPYDRKRSSGDSNSGVYPAIVRGLQVSTLSGQLNWIVANPAYLQILHSPQVAITRGAGGRGEALGIRRAGAKLQPHGVSGLVLFSPSPVHIHVHTLYILCVKTQELTLVSSF